MSTNYPTSLDTLTNPTSTDRVDTVDHASQHANANDAIEALQAKVGADSSAVTTSHDYKLGEVTSTDKAVGKTATQTLTNKTLTSPTINTASIAGGTQSGSITDSSDRTVTGTIDAGGATSFEIPNSAAPTVDANGEIAIDTSVTDYSHGLMKYYSGEEVTVVAMPTGNITSPQDGDVISYNATSDEFELSQPTTQSVPGPSVIDLRPLSLSGDGMRTVYMDEYAIVCPANSGTGFKLYRAGTKPQTRNTTSEWAAANEIRSVVILNGYMYLLIVDTDTTPDTWRVYRYLLSDVTSSPTQMTFSGSNQITTTDSELRMTCDGVDFYITYLAGNSANPYAVGKYTLSGTTLTYSSTITLSGTPTFTNIGVFSNGDIYITDSSSLVQKFNSSGTNQYTAGTGLNGSYDDGILIYNDEFYTYDSANDIWYKMPV